MLYMYVISMLYQLYIMLIWMYIIQTMLKWGYIHTIHCIALHYITLHYIIYIHIYIYICCKMLIWYFLYIYVHNSNNVDMGIHNYIYIIYIYIVCICNTRTDTMQYTQQLRGPQVLKRSKTKDKGFKEWLFIWICGALLLPVLCLTYV